MSNPARPGQRWVPEDPADSRFVTHLEAARDGGLLIYFKQNLKAFCVDAQEWIDWIAATGAKLAA